jgi:hypothetical protein
LGAAPDAAAEVATRFAADATLSQALRDDAFHIEILARPATEARKLAVSALRGKDTPRRKFALKYLVHGTDGLQVLRNEIYLDGSWNSVSYSISRNGTPIVPQAPPGVKVEDVRPLLADDDPEVAACAGYLTALLGDADGLDPLLAHWRKQRGNTDEWNKLVYQAIAVTDQPKYLPVLQDIYHKLSQYEVSEFYWTIRIMSGPEILRFRKQIRDDVGAEKLQ